MKLSRWAFLMAASVILTAGGVMANETNGSVYRFKVKTIDGKETVLSHYKGKVLLIVNVASKCGFTPQYAGLEKVFQEFKAKGFEVLGFPCNQFGSQEPGTAAEIKSFCDVNYGVKFPLFAKIEVNGPGTDPLYQFLEKTLPDEKGKGDIGWNFTKFLVDRRGHPVKRFGSPVKPEEIEADIKALLAK